MHLRVVVVVLLAIDCLFAKGIEVKVLSGHADAVTCVSFTVDGNYLISGSIDKTIGIWEVSTGRLIQFLAGHTKGVSTIAVSKKNKYLFSGGFDKTVRAWPFSLSSEHLTEGWVQTEEAVFPITRILLSDREDVGLSIAGSVIRFWDPSTGKTLDILEPDATYVHSVLLLQSQNQIILGNADGVIKFIDRSTKREVKRIRAHRGAIRSIAFSPDNSLLASGGEDGNIAIWEITSGKLRQQYIAHGGAVTDVAFLPPGDAIVSSGTDKLVKIWSVAGGKPTQVLSGHSERINSIALSSDGAILASASSDKTIRLWYLGVNLSTIERFVQKRIDEWQKKGRYEKVADYRKRMAERQTRMSEFFAEAFLELGVWKSARIHDYDPENETFKISLPVIGDIVLPVPLEFAEKFEADWSNSIFKPEFIQSEKGYVLKRLEVRNGSRTTPFVYESGKEVAYDPIAFNIQAEPMTFEIGEISTPGPVVVDIETEIPEVELKNPDAVAVVIGISKYKNRNVPAVDYASRDAAIAKEYFVKVLGIDSKRIIHAIDENASLADFKRIFEEQLRNYVRPGKSDVFVYYSGHGAPDPETKQAFFVPHDCNPAYAKSTGYPLQEFYGRLAQLRARSVTVVLDACFSGSSEKGALIQNISPIFLSVEAPTVQISNSIVFSSSSGQQVATWYHDMKHGLFTYYFLKGLRGDADDNKDKNITVEELEKYLLANVPDQARYLSNREQTPQVIAQDKKKVLVRY
ncbi:MAG TPA: caspase family protein [Bacteroidota bacterium]|nr:caspase family protein [Bacteroidota bacterium]